MYEKLQLSCIKHREEKQIYICFHLGIYIYAPPPSIARIASVRAIVSPGFEIKLAASVSCVALSTIARKDYSSISFLSETYLKEWRGGGGGGCGGGEENLF